MRVITHLWSLMAKSEDRVANLVNTVNLTVKFFKNLLLVASCYFFLAEIKEASKANWIKESVVIRQVNILEDWAVWLPSSQLSAARGAQFRSRRVLPSNFAFRNFWNFACLHDDGRCCGGRWTRWVWKLNHQHWKRSWKFGNRVCGTFFRFLKLFF